MARPAPALGCSRHERGGSRSGPAERNRMVERAARAFREIPGSTNARKLIHVGPPHKNGDVFEASQPHEGKMGTNDAAE
jgi:hypothetical protein